MSCEKELLLGQIEVLRAELNSMSLHHKLTDAPMITLSQELDKLLNQYYKLGRKPVIHSL